MELARRGCGVVGVGRVAVTRASRSAATSSSSSSTTPSAHAQEKDYKVRVLRYPDGYERVLRYPKDKAKRRSAASGTVASTAQVETTHADVSWDIAGARASPEVAEAKPPTQPEGVETSKVEEEAVEEELEVPSTIPDTPTELLRKQKSEEFLLSRKLEWDYAKSSFEVMDSCPWVEPRPLWVLGTLDAQGGVQTFTLRTRVSKDELEAEMEMLVGKRLSVSHLTDGVVTFESKGIAEHFAEENTTATTELFVFEVGSHELFQMTADVKAVVVLMKSNKSNPSARMLATVLRDQPELDT